MSAQVVKGILNSGLLSNPVGLLKVLSGAAPDLSTDSDMSLTDLLQVGETLRGISSKDVVFVTVPNEPYPPNPDNTVQFAQPQAGELFSAIARDATIAKSGKVTASPSPAISPSTSASASASTSASASASAAARTPALQVTPSRSLSASPSPDASATAPGIGSLATSGGGITAEASCGSDASAFDGPLSP